MTTPTAIYLSSTSGIQLAATSFGSVGDPVVVMLHGAGQTRHSWHKAGIALAESGWHAVSIDTRGHGESGWSEDGDYSVDTLVRDVVSVVNHFSAPVTGKRASNKPVVVGASLGGICALLAEGESDTSLFQSLVLVDVTPTIDEKGVARIIRFMKQYQDGFACVQEAGAAVAEYQSHRKQKVREGNTGGGEAGRTSGLMKNLRLAKDGRYYWHWDPRLMQYISRFDESIYQRQREAAAKLELPVLLVRGQQSEIVDSESVSEFLELVPHARFVDIIDAAHMVVGDNNDVFVKSVLDFIAAA